MASSNFPNSANALPLLERVFVFLGFSSSALSKQVKASSIFPTLNKVAPLLI